MICVLFTPVIYQAIEKRKKKKKRKAKTFLIEISLKDQRFWDGLCDKRGRVMVAERGGERFGWAWVTTNTE